MADLELVDEDTPLGEALPIGDLPNEFGDLKDIDNFDFLGDDDGEPETPSTTDTPPVTPEPETKTDEATGVDPQTAEKLTAYDQLDNALRNEPAKAVHAIIAGMSVSDRAALISELSANTPNTQQTQTEKFDLEAYEPQGEMEEALAKRWNSIEAIPHVIEALNDTDRRIEQGFSSVVPHITDANIAAQIALSKVSALCDALGIELPDPDSAAILKELQGGKITYRDAVRKNTAGYKGQVDAHKQTRARRPDTIGGGSKSAEKIAAGTDAVTIARRLGVLPPR